MLYRCKWNDEPLATVKLYVRALRASFIRFIPGHEIFPYLMVTKLVTWPSLFRTWPHGQEINTNFLLLYAPNQQ